MEDVNLVFDTCHLSKGLCLLLFRRKGKNLHFDIQPSEKIVYYERNLRDLSKSYNFLSFTIDGRRGVIQLLENLFPEVPIQLCQFHQVKTVLTYTTRNPKTECGKDLKRLILSLKRSSKKDFIQRFNSLRNKYKEFLLERNEAGEFSHRKLRSGFRSIKTNLPYLFTYEDYPALRIEKTTNSCDGYFTHLQNKINVHRGISLRRKIQLIFKLLSS